MQRIVNVVIRHKSKFVDREYSYLTEEEIKPGTLVWVSFGKGDSPYEAVVMSGGEIGEEAAQGLKRVLRVEDFVVPALKLELAQWIKKMYLCSLNEALSLFIPKHREMSVIYDVFFDPVGRVFDRAGDFDGAQNGKKQNSPLAIIAGRRGECVRLAERARKAAA